MTIALCAVLCGANDWVAVETFGRTKEAWLRTFLLLPGGIPSRDTFGRVFARLEPTEFRNCVLAWVQAIVGELSLQVVALDGKRVRRSGNPARGTPPLHLLRAWATASGLGLGQEATDTKSKEITALPRLRRLLALEGCGVTSDAMGCQSAIAAQIVAQGADYVLALKGHQPTLHALVVGAFAETQRAGPDGWAPAEQDQAQTWDKGRGRLERRRYNVLSAPALLACLDPPHAWPGRCSVVQVVAKRRRGAHRSVEARSYRASVPPDSALLGPVIRPPWQVENCLHWGLDVQFREDACRARVGHGAQHLALLRHLAFNLSRQETSVRGSLAAKRFPAALVHDYLLRLLAGLAPAPSDGVTTI